jgi:hypothetical protein
MDNRLNFFSSVPAMTSPDASKSRTYWIIGIVVVCIIAMIAYWWFKPRAEEAVALGPYVLTPPVSNAPSAESIVTVFNQGQVDNHLGNNFTFGFFVYMDDVNRERIPFAGADNEFRFRPFIHLLGVGDIMLDPIHQRAHIRIKPLTKDLASTPHSVVTIDNVMISRWNQIVITMEGRTVDVYLNGALAKSTLLENLPILSPSGVLLETSPDFAGQAGLIQAWPRRLTESQVIRNYKRNVDSRGKPAIPDKGPHWSDLFKATLSSLCDAGFCGFRVSVGPTDYIDYEFA